MKQGRGHSTQGQHKTEPKAHAINPAYPAQLGTMKGNHITDGKPAAGTTVVQPMHEGRGFSSPMVGRTNHPAGSQGRRK